MYEPNNLPAEAEPITLTGTSTSIMGLRACTDGDDFFRFTVPAGNGLKVTMDFIDADSDLDLFLYRAADSRNSIDQSTSTTDQEVVEGFLFAEAAEVLLRVQNYSQRPAGYRITIDVVAGGTCTPDDGEEDDTEAQASPIQDERVNGRSVCAGDADFYTLQIPRAGPGTMIRINHGAPAGTLNTGIYLPGQMTPLATGVQTAGTDTITLDSMAATTYVLKVEYAGTLSGALYDIHVLNGGLCEDDFSEENDDAASATSISLRAFSLTVCEADADYYTFTVPRAEPGAEAQVSYNSADGDLDAVLFTAGGEAAPITMTGAYDAMLGGKRLTFTSEMGTAYFLRVRNPSGLGGVRYDVELNGVAFCVDDLSEPDDSVQTATPITDLTGGVLCGSNPDFVSFTVASAGVGTRLVISQLNQELDAELTDAAGTPVTTTQERTSTSLTLTFTSTAGTSYAVRLSNRAGSTGARYSATVFGAPPTNETCMTAETLTASQTVTGSTEDASNDLEFTSSACTGYSNRAGDVMYRVTVGAGQTLTATLDSQADLALWLLESCQSRCCWEGTDQELGGLEEVLTWTNPTNAPLELVLGVDGWTSSAEGEFSLAIDIQ